MTRYFMRDTPLCQIEQQMMTPPYFKPRGHGRYYPGFQYSRDDMECPYCMNFRRNHPCPLEQCVCLDERIVAGAIDLNQFVRDCFFPEAGVQLQARLERSFNGCSIGFFLSDSHRERWQHWRARCYRMSDRNLAAPFLLTAYEGIWRRMIWKFDARGFDFRCDNIHELNELALVVEKFSIHDRKKLGAAVSMAKPENASQIRRLAENMDLFEFAPGAHTPEEYGRYMIQKSGHFEYDPNLDEFYDYERYGLQHMDYQSGVFTDRGYIAYDAEKLRCGKGSQRGLDEKRSGFTEVRKQKNEEGVLDL